MGLVFGGQDFAEYGVMVDSAESWPKPERDSDVIQIPGRNGDLIIDNGRWKNVDISYNCLIADGWQQKFDEFCAMLFALRGYHDLQDDAHPNEIRMASFSGPVDPELWFTSETGIFRLTFNCMPQRWLRSGLLPQSFTAGGAITNPTLYPSQPYLRVVGHGQLIIGGKIMTVAESPFPYIDIDCQAMDAHYGATNANSYITLNDGDFPTLPPGESTFTIQSSITRLEITPRWWTI